jgi:putative membrane protein
MMWWGDRGWDAGDWLAMSLMMVAFWGLLVALVVWLVRSSRTEPTLPSGDARALTPSADEVLDERFARGEIDEDEFTRRRQVLHASIGGSTPTGR